MRMCQSLLVSVLAISLISCQSTPNVPVRPAPHTSSSLCEPDEPCAPPSAYEPSAAEPGKAITYQITGNQAEAREKAKTAKKAPPVPPSIVPHNSGLISPSPQEVPEGSPLAPQKERQRVVFNFEKADIAEVTSQIFGDQLKLNYVMDQTLQGRISMYIEGEYDTRELLQMVGRAFEANGVSVIPKKGFYYIQSSQKGGTTLPIADAKLLAGDKLGPRPLIVIYRLRFMDNKQAANLITPFLSPGRKVIPEPLTNSLIFIEDTENARALINLLKTVDINILQEISMEIVPLSSLAPQDAVQGMDSLLGKLGGLKESNLKNSLALIPLQNFGGVLVMAQTPELLKSAKQWLQALDVQGLGSAEEIYIYFVQNGLASDIAGILNEVFGIGGGGGRRMEQRVVPSGKSSSGGAFGGTSGGLGGSSSGTSGLGGSMFGGSSAGGATSGGSMFGGSSTTGTSAAGTGGTSGTGGISGSSYRGASSRTGGGIYGGATGAGAAGGKAKPAIFTGEVMIIPDEVNNAVVIRSNATDYAKIKKTLDSLDILPRAVLIEVMIAEVQLTKEFQYGLQYFFQTNPQTHTGFGVSLGGLSNSGTSTSTTNSAGSTVSLTTGGFPDIGALATPAGSAFSWVANAQNLAFFLKALSTKTTVNVLSTPTLLATDNKDATITVGGRQPIPTGSYAGVGTSTSNVFSTIEYAETGVILNVTPHINAGGLVRMEVEQTIRRTDPNSVTVGAGNTAPSFTERNVKTTLLAQSGSTVVIGGIIDASKSSGKNGIPFLQDVPLLSPLFSSINNNLNRTELIVAITPHVIDQRGSEAPRELLQKLKGLRQRIGQ